MKTSNQLRAALVLLCFGACQPKATEQSVDQTTLVQGTYAYDASFLRKYTRKTIELKSDSGQSKILLSADYQGRVMTSTAAGDSGASFGWINYNLISSGEKKQQFNPVGGEERFWLGPEGGQYSLYFKKGDPFVIDHWQVPYCIDTVMYDVAEISNTRAVFTSTAMLTNYSGAMFNIGIERSVSLLGKKSVEEKIKTSVPENIQFVAYETENRIKNNGPDDWRHENGLLSIWLLGMMTPTEHTVVIIPFAPGNKSLITKDYFGEIPSERLTVGDSVLYFVCDGKYRSKIGLPPSITKSVAASYDFEKNTLTIILFPVEKDGRYVNSKWEIQEHPYQGDVVNSYNDGPLENGSQLGPFYELESSSAAHELKEGEIQEYKQTTCHFQGDYASMRDLTLRLLNIDIESIKK